MERPAPTAAGNRKTAEVGTLNILKAIAPPIRGATPSLPDSGPRRQSRCRRAESSPCTSWPAATIRRSPSCGRESARNSAFRFAALPAGVLHLGETAAEGRSKWDGSNCDAIAMPVNRRDLVCNPRSVVVPGPRKPIFRPVLFSCPFSCLRIVSPKYLVISLWLGRLFF